MPGFARRFQMPLPLPLASFQNMGVSCFEGTHFGVGLKRSQRRGNQLPILKQSHIQAKKCIGAEDIVLKHLLFEAGVHTCTIGFLTLSVLAGLKRAPKTKQLKPTTLHQCVRVKAGAPLPGGCREDRWSRPASIQLVTADFGKGAGQRGP